MERDGTQRNECFNWILFLILQKNKRAWNNHLMLCFVSHIRANHSFNGFNAIHFFYWVLGLFSVAILSSISELRFLWIDYRKNDLSFSHWQKWNGYNESSEKNGFATQARGDRRLFSLCSLDKTSSVTSNWCHLTVTFAVFSCGLCDNLVGELMVKSIWLA